jgi:hypothetical protein
VILNSLNCRNAAKTWAPEAISPSATPLPLASRAAQPARYVPLPPGQWLSMWMFSQKLLTLIFTTCLRMQIKVPDGGGTKWSKTIGGRSTDGLARIGGAAWTRDQNTKSD